MQAYAWKEPGKCHLRVRLRIERQEQPKASALPYSKTGGPKTIHPLGVAVYNIPGIVRTRKPATDLYI